MSFSVCVKLTDSDEMMPIHGSSRSNASATCVVVGILKFGSIVSTDIVATLEPSTNVPVPGTSGLFALNTGACFTYGIWPAGHEAPVAFTKFLPLVLHSRVPFGSLPALTMSYVTIDVPGLPNVFVYHTVGTSETNMPMPPRNCVLYSVSKS